MSAAVIPPKALPSFFQNVEIIDPDALRSCRQMVSNDMKNQKLEGTITAAAQPILLSSRKQLRSIRHMIIRRSKNWKSWRNSTSALSMNISSDIPWMDGQGFAVKVKNFFLRGLTAAACGHVR